MNHPAATKRSSALRERLGSFFAAAVLAVVAGGLFASCTNNPASQASGGASEGAAGDTGAPQYGPFDMLGAPLVVAPNRDGFGLNVVLPSERVSELGARVRALGDESFSELGAPSLPAADVAEWRATGLRANTRYEYAITTAKDDGVLYRGEVTTQRDEGEAFDFVVLTDTHITPREVYPGDPSLYDYQETVLNRLAPAIASEDADFMVNLGDTLDFHEFGFNDPVPDARYTKLGYLNYRRLLGDALGNAAHYPVVGNWDGENGCFSKAEIDRSREPRMLYVPGPEPDSYREGGSDHEDYYAFTWGDALFVVLNVMTYTETCHNLSVEDGQADDWTLGEEQMLFLEQTLQDATSAWRFVFIHHAVGGAAGSTANSNYGRGGGQAAHVGEQARVHELMMDYGVQIFFYGHDHVFTDMVVDDIHYTLPGSAGAPWKFTPDETGYTDYFSDSGYGRVSVSPDAVEVAFINVDGDVLESYTLE